MEGTLRILKRFVGSTMLISILLLVLNFIVLFVWIGNSVNEGKSPSFVVRAVAEGLHRSSQTYSLNAPSQKLLDEHRAWAMLISEQGRVTWNYKLPRELEHTYSLTDAAKFSRSYLKDYPVFNWEHSDGLVVVGYPKGTLAKYEHVLSVGLVENLPLKALFVLAGNILLALLLSLLIGSKLIRSIRPLTHGIQSLAKDKEVFVEPKGILANLAISINHAAALLKKKNDALKSRDEARLNWIAGISHDIRTPLSMVLGHASDLEENDAVPEDQRRQAGIVRKQAEKLRSLVHDLNLVSMLEYEMQPLGKKPLRLSVLARQVASELLNNGLDERFTLDLEILDEKSKVNGDERLLLRAMTNMVQNSIQHNPDGCRIRLQTSFDESRQICSLTVSDNGKGISRSELPDLLELPYSSQRKHPRQNGHGLGLPMAARIAKAHQGRLVLSSDTGQGFHASIELPAINPE